MTSADIRQSFLDFFKEKEHTIVPSASILPQSPGLLFTNAGMNQFVPYFLGTEKAPYSPPRAADTQKCIRAGGKHNDLEDVGYDTYHHTFFEMLGNWSFGNYFKKEAIAWAWELVVERWGLPASRLYATVYAPSEGDPSEFDQEAWDLWAAFFEKAGLDPKIHIVNGNVKDNFWMMGETGPCGPCSELHVDMTPNGDTGGKLVNMDSDLCIEIWNLVFIQYNAEADGTFRDLPAKHVDTGMGFERVCSLIQNTKGFTDFSEKPTNYATDVFQPIFRKLEELSGKKYVDIYPNDPLLTADSQLPTSIAFRVIADHIRTLSFSIADGIMPGNTGRNYVLRRILRRAVKYGRTLGFTGDKPFLPELVDTLVAEFGKVFPEIGTRAQVVKETLATEEDSFNKTLDRGMEKFEKAAQEDVFPPEDAFQLYDTFGFPLDLTALLCRERGISLDEAAVEALMEEARELSRGAQKKTIVRALDLSTDAVTEFVGFDQNTCDATILEVHEQDDAILVITDKTVFFTEMGGQEGDRGNASSRGSQPLTDAPITSTQKIGNATGHIIKGHSFNVGDQITLSIDRSRRAPIEAHHTATHLLHWALHEVVSQDAAQQGSSVSPDRLRFDFNSKAVTPEQITAIEEKVNASIEAGDLVSWIEVPHTDVKDNKDIMQFFGDKYGDLVRVVQIGGGDKTLDGYSMELCGGTHVTNTKDIGLFKIKSEGAIASGVRRIEAVCGPAAEAYQNELLDELSQKLKTEKVRLKKLEAKQATLEAAVDEHTDNANKAETDEEMWFEIDKGIQQLCSSLKVEDRIKTLDQNLQETVKKRLNIEKALKKAQAAGAARMADGLLAESNLTGNIVISTEGPAALLQELLNGLKKVHFTHAAFFIVDDGDKLHLGALCGEDGNNAGHGAGNLIRDLAPIAGGKGGGKPDMARGAAGDRDKAGELLAAAETKLM
ncbi:alanine--tRNA ligase [Akkermansiaceae bacterium]|nr:alanine--tRNA ligase [Akkermansiaceae bacterium]MDB4537712.1 alanine--tRNA ligase [Akkermansiaceae bacterium]